MLVSAGGPVWAQTNVSRENPSEQQTEISSDAGHYDGNARQMVYLGHVIVTDRQIQFALRAVDGGSAGGRAGVPPTLWRRRTW